MGCEKLEDIHSGTETLDMEEKIYCGCSGGGDKQLLVEPDLIFM